MNKFIELNRSFASIPKDRDFKDELYDFSPHFGILDNKKWKDLLQLWRVIILAEAGAGKTEEIQAVTKRLRSEGKNAFFFRLEHLCSNFEASFEIGTSAEFEYWLTSDELGWFFLDSVDEARLAGKKNFEAAIRNFSFKLGDSIKRSHIFITSRLSEWRPQSDLSLIMNRLPFIESTTTAEDQEKDESGTFDGLSDVQDPSVKQGETKLLEPSVFALLQLTKKQIAIFSKARGVKDLDVFLDAIERAEADIYSGRPLDLIELIEYWERTGEIANHAKLIEHSISLKLKESDPDRDDVFPITAEEARAGAEMIAAAVTFQKKDRILIPDKNMDPEMKHDSIDAKSILSSWDHKKISAILQRPIFDKAIYGAVRFHHRSVREYLTARWLQQLLINGKSRRAIEGLFFKEMYGEEVVIPSMRPVLAWLILFDDHIRVRTAKLAPELFIQGGDPSELPAEFRKNMLESFCDIYSKKSFADLSFDLAELRRFAHKDLDETVNRLLEIYSGNDDIRELLLRLVWQGELRGCADKALEFALEGTVDVYTRVCGIRAVSAIGSEEQKNTLIKKILINPDFKYEQPIAELIDAFAPDRMSILDIFSLLARMEDSSDRSRTWIDNPLKEFSQYKCPTADIVEWIRVLLPLIKQPPVFEHRYFEVSKEYGWLLPYALMAAERLVRKRHPDSLNDSVLETISLAQIGNHYHEVHWREHAFADLVPEWPELNHALFWFDVKLARNYLDVKKEKRLTEWWRAGLAFHHFWKFTENDFETAVNDIADKSFMDNRLVALSLAYQIYKENKLKDHCLEKLKKATNGATELQDALNNYLNPTPIPEEEKRWERRQAEHKRRQEKREEINAANRRDWQEWLKKNVNVLRDTSIASKGKTWNATVYLIDELRHIRDKRNRWAVSNWEDLIPEFGQEVADAYRDGCIEYWRKFTPKIRSEGIKNPHSRPIAVSVGLSGLEMEADQNPDWPANLSNDEATLACRYALHEMNGFPGWLQRLHTVFPDIVEECLLTEIEWEFSQYEGEQPCHYVLDDVVWQLDWIKPRISGRLILFLKEYEPKHDDAIHKALGIILYDPDLDKNEFVSVAKSKINGSAPINRQALWLAAWMRIKSETALQSLTSILEKMTDADQATELVIQFVTALFGERHERFASVHQDFVNPSILPSLIKLTHKHIRIEEDNIRVGGRVYTPTPRDDAQDARSRLYQLLYDIPGKASYLALLDLAEYQTNEEVKKRYRLRGKRWLEENAEAEPWRSGDIALFAKEAEIALQNHRELYDLAVSRIFDLKADMEHGDDSLAETFIQTQEERLHRIMIGKWLRDRSQGRYSVPQEEELADRKKPDIRIHGYGFDNPVPIELKVVDNWTGPKLVERFHNQLCGQYLRDIRSNCGIYILVCCDDQKHWQHPESGKNLEFSAFVQLLKKEAEEIISTDQKIESIEIIGIDLTKRQKT